MIEQSATATPPQMNNERKLASSHFLEISASSQHLKHLKKLDHGATPTPLSAKLVASETFL
jgi:hypothetical protein